MAEAEAVVLCHRVLDACQALASCYEDLERRLSAVEADLPAVELQVLLSRLDDAEADLRPLLEPLDRLRVEGGASRGAEAERLIEEIDALAPQLARRHGSVLRAAAASRDACAGRLVALARARTTRAGYVSAGGRAPRFASRLA